MKIVGWATRLPMLLISCILNRMGREPAHPTYYHSLSIDFALVSRRSEPGGAFQTQQIGVPLRIQPC